MPMLHLTERSIAKLAAPDPSGKQSLYWDATLRGFGVLVSGTTNSRSYVCQRDIGRRSKRIAIAAVARGATIVEKHLTLDKGLPGPDHRASLDPDELAALIRAIRRVESALGDGDKRPKPSEADTRRVARKSLVAARPIRAGERLTRDLIAIKRPGTGISPADLDRALGRVVVRALAGDDVIDWAALGDA